MADIAHLYPPNPAAVPEDLTKPTGNYRFRVFIVLVSLLVFLAVYLGLTIGSAYACYYCFSSLGQDDPPKPTYTAPSRTGGGRYPPQPYYPPREDKPVFGLILGGIASGLLFLFLVKGLFKRTRRDLGVRVEVSEKDQPALFAFIRQLCKDTGAPFPHRVFLTPDVNAAVSFEESLLNLVFPSRKNLIIGLGLVNRLNLTEFKAVLAHEFGHFSQDSMKLGSYVYTANRVVVDVVYGRDGFDYALDGLCRTDIRIAIFAWGFYAILWVMRKGLEFLFRGINFAHVSLSRQMEYNADLVAVSVTGSDPLIFALARLDFAGESLGQAWNDLTVAADHKRFSRDLYYHHTKAAEFLKVKQNNSQLGEVPPLPDDPTQSVQVFKPEDTGVPKMWATHPSNYDREMNAKHRYFRGPIDNRSAWELFENAAKVKEAITRRLYALNPKWRGDEATATATATGPAKGNVVAVHALSGTGYLIPVEEPEAIQAFIDDEHAETTYHPRYHGLYENRYIKPGELAEMCTRACVEEFDDRTRLAEAHTKLTHELESRMDAHKKRSEELGRLSRIVHGAVALTGSDFEHRGGRYRLADAKRLLKEVEGELDRDFEWMHSLDREVFRVHYAMASQLGDADRTTLEERYRFHLAVQVIHSTIAAYTRHIDTTLAGMAGRREVSQAEFQQALAALREANQVLRDQLDIANRLFFPPLKNLTAGEPLGPFLLSVPVVANLPNGATTLEGVWIGQLMNQMGEVTDKAARILFKSLGGLLAIQEGIADRWAAPPPPPPEPAPEPTPESVPEPAPVSEAAPAAALEAPTASDTPPATPT